MQDSSDDAMDRLLARMESVEPPPDFLDRVLSQASAAATEPVIGRVWGAATLFAGAYLLALAGLAVLAYELGLSIARDGTSTLVSVLLADVSLFQDAPGPYLGAIVASVPWLHLAAVGVDLVILAIMTQLVLKGTAPAGEGRSLQPRA